MPLPAPASSSRSPSRRSIARHCSSVHSRLPPAATLIGCGRCSGRRSRRASRSTGTASARRRAAAGRARPRARSASSSSASTSCAERRVALVDDGAEPGRRRRTPRGRADRRRAAAGRRRRPASRPQQPADDEHVQRDLELAVLAPPRDRPARPARRRSCSRAPGVAVPVDVDAVDHAAHPQLSPSALAVPRTSGGSEPSSSKPKRSSSPSGRQARPRRRLVLQVAAQVGLDRAQRAGADDGGLADRQRAPPRPGELGDAADRGSPRRRRASSGVTGPPSSASSRSSTACMSVPRVIGSGSGAIGRGSSWRSTSHCTGQSA